MPWAFNTCAKGGGVLNGGGVLDENAPLAGAAAIGSGSVADGATEVKSDITIEGKVTIDATGGGDVALLHHKQEVHPEQQLLPLYAHEEVLHIQL